MLSNRLPSEPHIEYREFEDRPKPIVTTGPLAVSAQPDLKHYSEIERDEELERAMLFAQVANEIEMARDALVRAQHMMTRIRALD